MTALAKKLGLGREIVPFLALFVGAGLILVLQSWAAPAPLTGDINHDGVVNVFDLSILLSKWQTSDANADLNHDGVVNVFDLSMLLSNWGATASPSPSLSPLPSSTATPTPSPTAGPNGCFPSTPAPTNSDPGTTLLADNFESGGFSNWTTVTKLGDATATVQSAIYNSLHCAAKIHVTANLTSEANLIKALPSPAHEIWASGWFNITREGANTASNVPTMRFFNGTTRLVDVSRQNGSGMLFVRWPAGSGISWNPTGQVIPIGQGFNLKVHLITAGAQSQVQVWLNGNKVFDRSSSAAGFVNLGANNTFNNFMIGAEHDVQDGDFVVDDVILKSVN